MNVLTPIDLSHAVDKEAKKVEDFKEKLINDVRKLMPVGITLCGNGDGDGWLNVCHSKDFKNKDYVMLNKSIAHKYSSSSGIRIEKHATASDIYRVCGVLQLMASVDFTILGRFAIEN